MSNAIRRQGRAAAIVLIAPFLVLFTIFFLAPIGFAIVESLFAVKSSGLGFGPPEEVFVFFQNYVIALSSPSFLASAGRLVLFSVIEVPLMIATALILALLIDSAHARFVRFFRVVALAPYAIPGVIAAILWGFLYLPATSPILQVLASAGIEARPLDSGSVLFAIANIALWTFAGYNMYILLSSLSSIPRELFEAAKLDGAGEWATMWLIKLPLLRPSIVLITVFTMIGTLQLFAEPLVLRPLTTAISSDFTPNLAAYNQTFAQGNPNLAAAMAVIVAVVGFVFSFCFLRFVNRRGSSAW